MKKLFCIIVLLFSCKEVYNPPLKNPGYNYLVVEGNIVAGNDSTFIHLSRTVAVSDTSTVQPELNATVKVEGQGGEIYQLQEQGNGVYFSTPLNISPNENYRVHIFTSNGREYASDYVPVKQTPPIDSVSWTYDPTTGVAIYVNTHDATNSSQYYRWQYVETWEHRPKYSSELIYDASIRNVRLRQPYEQIYRCWNENTSSEILIATTAGLSSDVIYQKPLITIPYGSTKIDRVYSILVTQYALTKEAYEYWDNLKKNTENLGSIFDPQPFADYGNMHAITDPSEPVLGYISACSAAQQRIYIDWSQVQWPFSFPTCEDTTVVPALIDTVFSGFNYLPIDYVLSPPGAVFGSSPECVDCRLTGGGTTVKPSYMP
jgi:hypothetical protein